MDAACIRSARSEMDAARQHATSILALLHAHAYLLTHLNDFFVCRCWNDVPSEWRPFLLSLSADELAALPSMTHPVPGAPASLVSFIARAASLALPRMPSQEERTRLCWASASKSTVSLSITAPEPSCLRMFIWNGRMMAPPRSGNPNTIL